MQPAWLRRGVRRPPPRIIIDEGEEPVTAAKRRRLAAACRQEAQRIRNIEELEVRELQRTLLTGLPRWQKLRNLPGAREALPFAVDTSHVVAVRGGYVACLCCGHIAGFKEVAPLRTPCRLRIPTGSRGAIIRFLDGHPPHWHASRPGVAAEWPMGEHVPELRLIGRGHLYDSDFV